MKNVALAAFCAFFILRTGAEAAFQQPSGSGKPSAGDLLSMALFLLSYFLSAGACAWRLYAGPAPETALYCVGLVLFAASSIGRAAALKTIRRNYSLNTAPEAGAELTEGGVYSVVRNPLYLFYTLETFSFYLAGPNLVSLAMVPLCAGTAVWRAGAEEKLLAEKFGAAYDLYRARTKRFIPFIY